MQCAHGNWATRDSDAGHRSSDKPLEDLRRRVRSNVIFLQVRVKLNENSVVLPNYDVLIAKRPDLFPRAPVLPAELWQLNRTWVFQGHGTASLQPQTMLLDEGHGRLYVGAKNTLFSLSLDRVNTQHREVGLFSCLVAYEEDRHVVTHTPMGQ